MRLADFMNRINERVALLEKEFLENGELLHPCAKDLETTARQMAKQIRKIKRKERKPSSPAVGVEDTQRPPCARLPAGPAIVHPGQDGGPVAGSAPSSKAEGMSFPEEWGAGRKPPPSVTNEAIERILFGEVLTDEAKALLRQAVADGDARRVAELLRSKSNCLN